MDGSPDPMLLRIFGAAFLITSSIALYFEVAVMTAVFKLLKKSEQFLLIFSVSIAEVLTTCQLVWLSVEIILLKTTGLSHKMESIILRATWYPEVLHYILIAINRSHAIIFPLAHHDLWSRKNLTILAILAWLIGWGMDYYITMGIPSDDLANFGHDIMNVEFGRMDRTKFGADDLLRANLILYLSIIVSCAIIYTIALVCLLKRVCAEKKERLIWQSGDAKLKIRLFIICFTNFIPFSAMIFFNYVSPPRTLFGSFFKTLFNILNSACNSMLLFVFSSWVRKKMPWPFKNCFPNFTPLQTAAVASKREVVTTKKMDGTTVF